MKYVYEVVTEYKKNGSLDSEYFDSLKAAEKYKEIRERGGYNVCSIAKWSVKNINDI